MTYDATCEIFTATLDASTLGWRPGTCPNTFYFDGLLWAQYETLRTPDGDCCGWTYAPVYEDVPALLTVLND